MTANLGIENKNMNSNFKGGFNFQTGNSKPLEKRKSVKEIIPKEKDIQKALFAWKKTHLRECPILNALFAVPNGIWTFKSMAAEMVRQGLTKGIQDVIFLAPSADGKYHGLLIEIKIPSEKAVESDEQIYYRHFFAELGFRTEVFRFWEDAAGAIIEHVRLPIKKPVRRG